MLRMVSFNLLITCITQEAPPLQPGDELRGVYSFLVKCIIVPTGRRDVKPVEIRPP